LGSLPEVCVTIDPFVHYEHNLYLELHKRQHLSFQDSLSRLDCCKVSITQVTQEESQPYTYTVNPFSSLNLVFRLHQAVSNIVQVHYISPNWNEAAFV